MQYKTVAERAADLAEMSDEELLKRSVPKEHLPGDAEKMPKETPYKPSKKALHRKMRSLGMGKHVAGNAHSLANHSRVPGEVTIGQGKTVAQWKAEKKSAKKRKNKMARRSRARNR